jgi:FkbM family methyltransferase
MATLISYLHRLCGGTSKLSFAQYGEDIIVQGIFDTLNLPTPHYIDIGAHHPTNLSNTYFFYTKGSSGVCIEPSPQLFAHIAKARPRDICLNVGISDTTHTSVPYYVLTAQTMNTFSKEDAEKTIAAPAVYGAQKIEHIEHIDLVPMNEILDKYFSTYGDFLSIDTEGFDEQIVRSIDFTKYRPKVLCIETIEQGAANTFHKNTELIEYLMTKNYFVYADTYVNTIFVDKAIWTLS